MGGNGGSSSRIVVLKGLAVFAVVIAGLGMGFVVMRHATKGNEPGASASAPAGQSSSATAAPRSATGPAASRPATTPRTTTPSARTPVASTPRKTTSTTSATARRPTAAAPRASNAQDQQALARPGSPAPAKIAARKTPVYEQHRWDEKTGELVIGKRRFLRKALAVRQLPLTNEQKEAIDKFEVTFHYNVDQQLAQVEANLESNVAAYEKAEKNEDDDGASHYVDEHAQLNTDRDAMLSGLDQQYADGLKEILPENQVDKLDIPREHIDAP